MQSQWYDQQAGEGSIQREVTYRQGGGLARARVTACSSFCSVSSHLDTAVPAAGWEEVGMT